jgi:glutaconate CoA-transferase, subunit A
MGGPATATSVPRPAGGTARPSPSGAFPVVRPGGDPLVVHEEAGMVGRVTTLRAAIAEHVSDGDTLFLGGFGHAVPTAAAHELIRQGKRDLTLVRSGCDIVVDQLVARGCVSRLVFGWVGNPGIGLAHAFRRAHAAGEVTIEEWTNFSLVLRLEATRLGVPFLPSRVLRAGDARSALPGIADVTCPYTGEDLTAVPAIPVDVALVHAQRADAEGDVQLWGVRGDTVTGALAARKVVATVEEIVDRERVLASPHLTAVPAHRVAAVVEVTWGAHPSYVDGYYGRDDAHYVAYDRASRTPEGTEEWIEGWVDRCPTRDDYLARVPRDALVGAAGGRGTRGGADRA